MNKYLQDSLRQLVISSFQTARSYPESRSVSTDLLILYITKAFQHNDVMFSEKGVSNILKASEVI